jgi:sorting nexin-25
VDADASSIRRLADYLPAQSVMQSLYKSVAIGVDELMAGPTLIEAVAVRLSQQATGLAGVSSTSITPDDMEGLINSDLPSVSNDEGITYFTAPICDLFVELFELKARNNWLRRQAILVILQTVLGGTIERCVSLPLQRSDLSTDTGNYVMACKMLCRTTVLSRLSL